MFSEARISKNEETGFSLVELMIAMTISLFLLLGITYVYTQSKPVYRTQENLARMQENGRLAFEYLSGDLRMAGYFGCASASMTYQTSPAAVACPAPGTAPSLTCTLGGTGCADIDFDPAKAVYGHESTTTTVWSPALTPALTDVYDNSDVLTIRGTASTNASIVKDASPTAANIKVSTTVGLAQGDVLMASNCKSSTIFQACNVTGGNVLVHDTGNNLGCASPAYGNSCKNWGNDYTGGTVLKLIKNTYFIKAIDGVPTLHRRNLAGTDQALVPNVENFQIKYGVAPTVDDYPTIYSTAEAVDTAGKWNLVKSIRIELLMRSAEDNITTAIQKNVYFNGADIVPTDRRLRIAMSTTIGVRNRTLLSTK